MWWNKQTQPATPSLSSTFSSIGTIDPPDEPAASQLDRTRSDHAQKQHSISRNDLRLDAIVEGTISLNCRRLTIGETARATANIVACEVIVYGELAGHLRAADRIVIKKHALVTGDLTTRRILIEDGAYFKGTVQIERRRKPRF